MTELHRVAQSAQRPDKPGRCRVRCKPDAWLIQDIQHPGKPRPDLGRETDALRLAAGKRAALPVEIKIAKPDLHQETQPRQDLARDFRDDDFLLVRERKIFKILLRLADIGVRKGCLIFNSRPAAVADCHGVGISGLSRAPSHTEQVRRLMYMRGFCFL